MGKKGSWFSAVKKVFSHDSRKDKKSKKSKKKSAQKESEVESEEAQVVVQHIEDVKLIEVENEQNKQAISLAFATAAAAGAAVKGTNWSKIVAKTRSFLQMREGFGLFILTSENMEEFFKIYEPNIYGSKQSSLGMELVREMDGNSTV